jgi:hypothetical protein
MPEWERVVATTIKDYIKGFEEDTLRNRKLLAMLKQGGRITFNHSGDGLQWTVRWQQADMTVNNGEQSLTFDRQKRFKTATLDYEGYALTDAMTKREKLKNRSVHAIVKYYDNMIGMLITDLEEQFGAELYIDSSASGNTGRISGIETMMGINGTINITTGVQRSANAADVVGSPSDTYAGLLTNLGNYDGSQSSQTDIATTWPAGTPSGPEYDFWAPIVYNYKSTAWGGATATWADNCVKSTRYALAHSRRNMSAKGGVNFIMMDRDLYRQFCDKYDSKEQLRVGRGDDYGLLSLGFSDMVRFDGAEVTSEFGIPATVCYGFNLNCMEMLSMQDSMFVSEGPEYDMATRSWRVVVDFLGQFKFASPRHFFKGDDIA